MFKKLLIIFMLIFGSIFIDTPIKVEAAPAGFCWSIPFPPANTSLGYPSCLNGSLLVYLTNTPVSWFGPGAPQTPFIITSSSAQTCTSIMVPTSNTTGGALLSINDASTAGQTYYLSIYANEGVSPACNATDLVGYFLLGQGQVINLGPFGWFTTAGFAYKLSGAASNNIVIWYTK